MAEASTNDVAFVEIGGLRAISVGDRENAKLTVVLLHGFQMEPGHLSPFAESLQVPAWFLFPEGPLAAEPTGRAWFAIDAKARAEALRRGPRDFATIAPPDLPASRIRLLACLAAVRSASGARPLIVGGFSQGGMLACDAVLHGGIDPAALVLLSSSRLAFEDWKPRLASPIVRGLPVLVSHGVGDPDLSFAAGEALRDCLVAAGADVRWVPFAGGHEIPLVVWRALAKRLRALA